MLGRNSWRGSIYRWVGILFIIILITAKLATSKMGDVIEFFRSQYDSMHVQFVQADAHYVKLYDKRREGHVLIPNEKWKDLEEYMLRFLMHMGQYLDVYEQEVRPPALTLEDMNIKCYLTPQVVVQMLWHGDKGYKALDVRRFDGDQNTTYPTKDGIRMSVSAVSSLYARRWQVRRDIYKYASMATVRSLISTEDHNIVQMQAEWLTQQHRKRSSARCDGCDQELGNQLAHACLMEHTPERLEETFDHYYERRTYSEIAALYKAATGRTLANYPTSLDPRQALYKVLTKRYFVHGPPDEPPANVNVE